jgi:very-short-patch-repair endonuclease
MKVHYGHYLKNYARKLRNEPTKAEEKLWQYLRGKQMMGYKFTRQKPIDKFIADFFCNKLQLVIEVDGYSHEFEEVIKRDILKEERLNELGLKILRFEDEEVMNDMDNVLSEIEVVHLTKTKE